MTLLNFSHPITDEQRAQIEAIAGKAVVRLIEVPIQFDHARPFHEQTLELLECVELSPTEWQTTPLLINLPSLTRLGLRLRRADSRT
jgi:hypothetical protein